MTELASSILDGLPPGTKEWVKSGEWQGGTLVNLQCELSRPVEKDLEENRLWLMPILKMYPDRAL